MQKSKWLLWVVFLCAFGFSAYYLTGDVAGLEALNHLSAHPVLLGTLSLTVYIAVVLFIGQWWKTLDEGQKEAQKWSMFWGSAAGITASVPIAYAAFLAKPGWLFGTDLPPEQAFAAGYFFLIICIAAGQGIAWALWWWNRR